LLVFHPDPIGVLPESSRQTCRIILVPAKK
jgi:hypothetical protein